MDLFPVLDKVSGPRELPVLLLQIVPTKARKKSEHGKPFAT